MREVVSTDSAPSAIGAYSQAVRAGDFLFISGQLGIDPSTGDLVEGGIEAQVRRALLNIKAILEEAGVSSGSVVKTTVFLDSIDDFKDANRVYGEFFQKDPPARAAFEVARLPLDALVEIEATAYLGG
jgi:2-iminobutanoate/2-iminopropanoate deaminase